MQVEKHSELDPAAFVGMIAKVNERFPKIKVICCTLREVVHTNKHNWSAVASVNGAFSFRFGVGWFARVCVRRRDGGGSSSRSSLTQLVVVVCA